MTALEGQFNSAADHFATVSKTLAKQSQQIRAYGMYKQAVMGDAPAARPTGTAGVKWDAWNKNRGQTKEQAMKRYVNEVRAIDPNWVLSDDEGGKLSKRETAEVGLKETFKAACEFARRPEFKQHVSSNVRNVLYGFYKQATVGPCNVPSPSILSVRV